MKIELGKQYENKSWRFLLPLLGVYGEEFVLNLNSLFKLAVGIGDENYAGYHSMIDNFYILVDPSYNNNFEKPFNWLSEQSYFVTSYKYSVGLMIVLKIESFEIKKIMKDFIKGNYSAMMKEPFIKDIYLNSNRNSEFEICTLNPSIKDKFIEKVNKEFNTELTEKDFFEPLKELELPPKQYQEIFNNNKNLFLNTSELYLEHLI